MITHRHVHVNRAMVTPQFWLLWGVLFLNVSAGIGILGMASPLLQEIFAGRLIGVTATFNELTAAQKGLTATIAASFLGLLSLFNIGGRFVWASCSDYIGRKTTYIIFFVLGIILYSLTPSFGESGNRALFVASFCIILSMYGGGFATVPAYLADMFGTQMVGAIHGRLLTAWSAAGIVGPVLVTYIREYKLDQGVPKALVYNQTLYILAGLLVVGFLCNLAIRPVADKHFMSDEALAKERQLAHERDQANANVGGPVTAATGNSSPLITVLSWAAVGIPIAWGVSVTVQKAILLFN